MSTFLKPSTLLRPVANVCINLPRPGSSEFNHFQIRNFGSGDIQAVAARIKSVKSIQKITKAMKMVAASKLRADQRRLEVGRPFTQPSQDVLNLLPISSTETGHKDTALVVMASDKGLCGGINSAVSKMTRTLLQNVDPQSSSYSLYVIGEKARSALQRNYQKLFKNVFTEVNKTPFNYAKAAYIAELLRNGNHDNIKIVYNHFKSVISYETRVLDVLTWKQYSLMNKRELNLFETEPDVGKFYPDFYEFYLTSCIYDCMLDSLASEQSARMSAMDNASSNATDMLSKLTLKYNRARQSKITLELIEIISGANAL